MSLPLPGILRLLLVLSLGACLGLAKPDFTGDWKMDPARSNFGPMPPPENLTMKINHSEPNLEISTHQVGTQGELKADYKYTTDGKECANTVRGIELKSTLQWDGETLRILTKLNFQGGEVTLQDKWTLADEGKTLTLDRQISSPQGDLTTKTVLVKQ